MTVIETNWERSMINRGIDRYLATVQRAKEKVLPSGQRIAVKDESSTSYGIGLIRNCFEDMESTLLRELRIHHNTAGPSRVALSYISACLPKEVAYITARCIIDSISRPEKQTGVALRISGHLEDHMRMASFDETHPKYHKSVHEDNKGRDYRSKRKVFVSAHDRALARDGAAAWVNWPKPDRIQIGVTLLDMFINATSEYQDGHRIEGSGFIERIMTTVKGKRIYYIVGTDRAAVWIKANMDVCMTLHPEFLPTLEPPLDWSTPYDGGYHLEEMRARRPLVKSSIKHLKILEGAYMPIVYQAINIAQSVAWAINPAVHDAAAAEFRAPHGIGMPGQAPVAYPPSPLGDMEFDGMDRAERASYVNQLKLSLTVHEKAAYSEWCEVKREALRRDQERVSKLLGVNNTLRVARLLGAQAEFYFVHSLDYRGRMYPCGTALTPQGADLAKGLLRWAKGNHLGENGYWHLCLHAAGCYGVDKVTLDERFAWVHEHMRLFVDTYNDPTSTRDWWGKADKPYTFLAVACEIGEAFMWFSTLKLTEQCKQLLTLRGHRFASGFKSHIPCQQDGSCNGLQHFSAMLLDPVGACAVNLSASERVHDIYQDTADLAKTLMQTDRKAGRVKVGKHTITANAAEIEMMDHWIDTIGVTRKTTKKPTMVVPYGGTKISCLEAVKDYVFDRLAEVKAETGELVWDDKQAYKAALIQHHYTWSSLDTVVVAARRAMQFLRDLVRIPVAENRGIEWTTPSGFIAKQEIKDMREKTVNIYLQGRMRVQYLEETDNINKYKMSSTFSPNFVHSLDASHLMMSVCAASREGINQFCLVHDSFGVPAKDCDRFHAILREQFVSIYKHNVLLALKRQLQCVYPDKARLFPPDSDVARGDFNINEVLKATYAFR